MDCIPIRATIRVKGMFVLTLGVPAKGDIVFIPYIGNAVTVWLFRVVLFAVEDASALVVEAKSAALARNVGSSIIPLNIFVGTLAATTISFASVVVVIDVVMTPLGYVVVCVLSTAVPDKSTSCIERVAPPLLKIPTQIRFSFASSPDDPFNVPSPLGVVVAAFPDEAKVDPPPVLVVA